jgi:hypothetical protein
MARFANGKYQVLNPSKYVGKSAPQFRSSWEATFMRFLDNDPNILQWASESIAIPYRNPLTGKVHNYIPDFFITYLGPGGQVVAEIVEIKPMKQTVLEGKKIKQKDAMVVAVNHAKWASCRAYCKQNGFNFRIVTERDLYRNPKRK